MSSAAPTAASTAATSISKEAATTESNPETPKSSAVTPKVAPTARLNHEVIVLLSSEDEGDDSAAPSEGKKLPSKPSAAANIKSDKASPPRDNNGKRNLDQEVDRKPAATARPMRGALDAPHPTKDKVSPKECNLPSKENMSLKAPIAAASPAKQTIAPSESNQASKENIPLKATVATASPAKQTTSLTESNQASKKDIPLKAPLAMTVTESAASSSSSSDEGEDSDRIRPLLERLDECWVCQLHLPLPETVGDDSDDDEPDARMPLYTRHAHPAFLTHDPETDAPATAMHQYPASSVGCCCLCAAHVLHYDQKADDEICALCLNDGSHHAQLFVCDGCERSVCPTCIITTHNRQTLPPSLLQQTPWHCPACQAPPALSHATEKRAAHMATQPSASPAHVLDHWAAVEHEHEKVLKQLELVDDPEECNVLEEHQLRLEDTLAHLQDTLEHAHGLDLAQVYQHMRIPTKRGIENSANPNWREDAERALDARYKKEEEECTRQWPKKVDDAYEDVEDLGDTGPQDSFLRPKAKGFASKQPTPTQEEIERALKVENEALEARADKLTIQIVVEKDDAVRQRKAVAATGAVDFVPRQRRKRKRRQAVQKVGPRASTDTAPAAGEKVDTDATARDASAEPAAQESSNETNSPTKDLTIPLDSVALSNRSKDAVSTPRKQNQNPLSDIAKNPASSFIEKTATRNGQEVVDLIDDDDENDGSTDEQPKSKDPPGVAMDTSSTLDRKKRLAMKTIQTSTVPTSQAQQQENEKKQVAVDDAPVRDVPLVAIRKKKPPEKGQDQQPMKPIVDRTNVTMPSRSTPIKEIFQRSTLTLSQTVSVSRSVAALLKEHQRDGVRFMWKNCFGETPGGCILAHCMGLGKTLTAISLMQAVLVPKIAQRILLLVPNNTIANWKNEFDQWLDGMEPRVNVLDMNEVQSHVRIQFVKRWMKDGGVLMSTPNLFNSRSSTKLRHLISYEVQLLVIDEAHQVLKNDKTQSYKALLEIATPRKICLTGTPLQNNLLEYRRMIEFIKPGLLQAEPSFEREFVDPIGRGMTVDCSDFQKEESLEKSKELHKLLNPFVHRKDATELLKSLPPMQHVVLHLHPSKLQSSLFRAYKKRQRQDPRYKNFFRAFTSLKPIHNHPGCLLYRRKVEEVRKEAKDDEFAEDAVSWWDEMCSIFDKKKLERVDGGYKIVLLLHILRQAYSMGEKVIIFSQCLKTLDFIETVLQLEDWLQHVPSLSMISDEPFGGWMKNEDFVRIDGSSSSTERGEFIEQFEQNADVKAFLLSSVAGGVGINLISANRVVLMDTHFNPAVAQQCVFRCYRYGQKRPVFVYRLLTKGSMEEKVYARSVTKTGLALRVIDKKLIENTFTQKEVENLQSTMSWVQCDRCGKWRVLYEGTHTEEEVDWYCEMNPDVKNNDCKYPERDQLWYEREMSNAEHEESQNMELGFGLGSCDSEEHRLKLEKRDEVLQHLLKITQETKKKGTLIQKHVFHDALVRSTDLDGNENGQQSEPIQDHIALSEKVEPDLPSQESTRQDEGNLTDEHISAVSMPTTQVLDESDGSDDAPEPQQRRSKRVSSPLRSSPEDRKISTRNRSKLAESPRRSARLNSQNPSSSSASSVPRRKRSNSDDEDYDKASSVMERKTERRPEKRFCKERLWIKKGKPKGKPLSLKTRSDDETDSTSADRTSSSRHRRKTLKSLSGRAKTKVTNDTSDDGSSRRLRKRHRSLGSTRSRDVIELMDDSDGD